MRPEEIENMLKNIDFKIVLLDNIYIRDREPG